jgi:hypothetical protein
MTKVQPARKLINRGKDLLVVVDGRLCAVQLLGWRQHTFRDDEGPTTLATIGVATVDGEQAEVVAVVDVSWARVVRLLGMSETGSWHVGRFWRDEEAMGAVSLEPPLPSDDMAAVTEKLNRLEVAAIGHSAQAALPMADVPDYDGPEIPPAPDEIASPKSPQPADEIPY